MSATPPSPLHRLTDHPGIGLGIQLYIKRDDQVHPTIAGNKWRKLEPVINLIQDGGFAGLLSYGGPFSNHLQAVAAAGKTYGFPTIGIVRGSSVDVNNPTLADAQANGMQLIPVTKQAYDGRIGDLQVEMRVRFPNYYHLPEGGATHLAAENCRRISTEILTQLPDAEKQNLLVCVPAGTGCTAAGVIAGLGSAGSTWIFPAVNYGMDEASVGDYLPDFPLASRPVFRLVRDYTFGGFAVHDPALISLVQDFQHRHGILLDPIYTAKMMFGLFDLLTKNEVAANTTIVALHTGGLQGWAGFQQRFGPLL